MSKMIQQLLVKGKEHSLRESVQVRNHYSGGMKQMRFKNLVVFSIIVLLLGTTGFINSQAVAAENSKQIVTVNIQNVLLASEAGQEVKKIDTDRQNGEDGQGEPTHVSESVGPSTQDKADKDQHGSGKYGHQYSGKSNDHQKNCQRPEQDCHARSLLE